ncbi:CPBP family intramembrane metalloprotease [Microbacterium caowuchunii]|uniref:CPBP family intramembrane glutamic endopeptidase n=1 Tax=Microbacterium caowuchunii TaxID=2614638 RepID=UPI0012458055|nr:type II CAAX endopeptidase family protein [Microbacterium caowuchunii]QEV99423.1 CPBP family intramembrane metalloprotease [Microbacterium caowuchunii]
MSRPVHRNLPAPTGGMLTARRPTGIILAVVVFAVLIVLIGIPGAVQQILASLGGVPAYSPSIATLIMLFSFPLAVLLLWAWLAAKEKRRFATLGFEQPRAGLLQAARGLLLGLAMVSVCVLLPVATGQATLGFAAPDATSWMFIALLLLGFLVQGSTEEILTRGYLTQAVARRWGLAAALVVQAVVFAVIHGANPGIGWLPLVNLVLFALFAGFYTLAEGSLWGICALHGAWNWGQGMLYGVPVSGTTPPDSVLVFVSGPTANDLLTGGAFGIEGSLVTSVILAVGAAVAFSGWRRRRR